MSDIIHLLPDSVANQIAAGEVIQRPASVLKELVENAIDAEAHLIQILITDAGRTCLQVIDDGKGMSTTDARLSFERHATSKIRQASDLYDLHTMGFRGEALASIAAVAQVELKTRQANEETGTRLLIEGSQFISQEAISCAQGSNFAVRNLFFNIPVRRKFLKSNATELSNIMTEFERIVLVHPDVAFKLHSNESELFNLPATSLRQRIITVFGKKLNQQLLSVEVDTTMVKISGFVGKPESSRKKGAQQFFFVNGRYMRHPYFYKAITDAFEQLIPVGEQVPFFIYFEVDPADIDVNIHPTKTEIKFEHEQAIWQILSAAVKESLSKFNAVPSIDFDTLDMPDIPVFDQNAPMEMPSVDVHADFNPFKSYGSTHSAVPTNWSALYEELDKTASSPDLWAITPPEESCVSSESQKDFIGQTADTVEKGGEHLQYKGRYILTSVKSGLMIIDQHRAHVRVLFDRYMSVISQHNGVSQRVLFPEILTLSPSEVPILHAITSDLEALGFELSDLGGGSFAIQGIPSGCEGLSPTALVSDMIHTTVEKGKDIKSDLQHRLALTLAKSSAIVYGQVLSNVEMSSLINSVFASSMPNYTPDGQVILTTLKDPDLEKMFR